MPRHPAHFTSAALAFLGERHLATLTSLRPDSSPHVVPVGFTWDQDSGRARVITDAASRKARNAALDPRVVLAQVDGARWLSLEGDAVVSDDPARVADAVARYEARYRPPRVNPTRVVIEIQVRAVLGSAAFFAVSDSGSDVG